MTSPSAPASGNKPYWQTKTFWVNLAALASLLIPQVAEWLKANPVEFASALAGLNVVLKFVTSGKASLDDNTNTLPSAQCGHANADENTSRGAKNVSKNRASGGHTLPLLFGAMGIVLLSSCGHNITAASGHVVISKDGKTLVYDKDKQMLYWTQETPVEPPVDTPRVTIFKGK